MVFWVWIVLQVKVEYTFGQWRGAIGSGHLVAWAVAVGFNSVGMKDILLGSSTVFVSLPSLIIKGRISYFFSLGKTIAHVSEDSDNPLDISIKSSMSL